MIPFKLEILVVIVVLVAAEAVLQIRDVRMLLPGSSVYYYPGVSHLLDKIDAREADAGEIDIIFIGSSITRTNLDPWIFDEIMAEAPGCDDLVTMNLSLSGSPLSSTRFYLDHVWPQYVEPGYVLLGVRYTDFLEAEEEIKPPFVDGPLENLLLQDDPQSQATVNAMENIALVRYHGAIGQFIQFPTVNLGRGQETDELGYEYRTSDILSNLEAGMFLETTGYDYPADLDFSVAVDELRTMYTLTTEMGGQFVVVNMPEHPDRWQQANGPAQYANYLSQIQAVADELGFLFIDVTDGDPLADWSGEDPNVIYSDYHHMNYNGAEALTTLVAETFTSLCAVD